MNEFYNSIEITELPIYCLKKGKINNEEVNNEKTILSFLDSAKLFKKRINCNKLIYIISQSKGEGDVKGENYEFDFKMLLSSNYMKLKSDNAPNIDRSNVENGFIILNDKKDSKEIPQGKNTFYKLNLYTYNQLIDENFEKDEDILHFLKKLKVDKNLFYFLPYEIKTNNKSNYFLYLKEMLQKYALFREKVCKKDLFFSIIINDLFCIFEFQKNNIIVYDRLLTYNNANYIDLKKLALY